MFRRGRPTLLGVVWIVIGLIVAANKNYLDALNTLEQVLSAFLAILLWPLLFLGVDLHVNL